MRRIRYDENIQSDNGLPFLLYSDICRSSSNISEDANWHEDIEIQFITEESGFLLID